MAARKPTKKQLATLRESLEAEREDLLAQASGLDAEADIGHWRDAGSDADVADSGSAAFERYRAQSLATHARRLIVQIDDALIRMDKGEYGRCERCGQWIDFDRLEAIPYATMCLEDKRRDETGR